MFSLSKLIVTIAIGMLFGGNSPLTIKSPGPAAAALHSSAAVAHTHGFTAVQGWDCRTSGETTDATFMDRWNGHWESASNDLMESTWTSCSNHWAYGYLTPGSEPSTVVPRVELSSR